MKTEKIGRPPRRFRYAEYYKTETKIDNLGKTAECQVYAGPYLKPCHSQNYKKSRLAVRFCSVLNLLCVLILLSVKEYSVYLDGDYALVPAAAALIPALYFLLGTVKMPEFDYKLQKDFFERGHIRALRSAWAGLSLSALTVILSILFFMVNAVRITRADILYFLIIIIAITACITAIAIINKLKYSE